jgi:hypothetical protein
MEKFFGMQTLACTVNVRYKHPPGVAKPVLIMGVLLVKRCLPGLCERKIFLSRKTKEKRQKATKDERRKKEKV